MLANWEMQKSDKHGEIYDAAARWAVRIDRGPLSQTEELALDRWLGLDSRHQGALVRAQALLLPAQGADIFLPAETASGRVAGGGLRWIGGMAAMAAAVTVSFLLLQSPTDTDSSAFETALGEVRRVPLEDGSVMTLNTASSVEVQFRHDQRGINLTSGEGFFEVAHDASRPFIVSAESYTIRAVGTAFVVRRPSEGALEVVVQEGIVELERLQADRLRLEAGARVDINLGDGQPRISALDGEQLMQELAWREGKIALTGQTLAEAAAAFNRYNTIAIRVAPELAAVEVVGWYASNDPIGFAKVVAETMDMDAEISVTDIWLRPRACDAAC